MKHTNSVFHRVLIAALLLCPMLNAGAEQALPVEPPTVLATIKPLQGLAYAVTRGVSEPELLLDGNMSPHLFQVKPSHIRSVSDADLVLWAGEGVERFLPSMIANFNPNTLAISMAEHSVVQHKVRDKHSDHDHDHSEIDYHLWLDPKNAISLVTALATQLSQLDPHNADQYQANAADFSVSLATTVSEITNVLSAAQGSQYLIYHDSLQYLEEAFGLGDAIIVAPKPQVQAGGRRMRELRTAVAGQTVECLISEPQFRSQVVDVLAEDLGLTSVLIDPLATDFEASGKLYQDWLLDLTTTLANCFKPGGSKQ